jgi:hypothetical protein
MDPRRVNDTLKIVGTIFGVLGLFGPVLMKPHATTLELIGDLLSVLPGAAGVFAAGVGTRGNGLEYADVAEAKAIAKLTTPPPPPPVPSSEDITAH